MVDPKTISFLKNLARNNHKTWFDANRPAYEAARQNIERFAGELIKAIATFDASVGHLNAKECLFRINRDVRFSKNKDPYKTNMAIYISKGGKKAFDVGGYYLHVEPEKSFLAGGIWMPPAPVLKKIRTEIDYELNRFKKIVESASFKNTFGELDKSDGAQLTRPPKGYEADNPAIEYLKLKSFIGSKPLADDFLTQPNAVKDAAALFRKMYPLIQFLNTAVEDTA